MFESFYTFIFLPYNYIFVDTFVLPSVRKCDNSLENEGKCIHGVSKLLTGSVYKYLQISRSELSAILKRHISKEAQCGQCRLPESTFSN